MANIVPLAVDSWILHSNNLAIKKMDKSSFLHFGTGIPRLIVQSRFFPEAEKGASIILKLAGREFSAQIVEKTSDRIQLLWGSSLQNKIQEHYPSISELFKQGLEPSELPSMEFTRLGEQLYEIEFKASNSNPKVGDKMSFWIIQSNPNTYHIQDAINELDIDYWVTRNRPLKAGDKVVFWQAYGRNNYRGIVGFGEVIGNPVEAGANIEYFVNPNVHIIDKRVPIRYYSTPHLPLKFEKAQPEAEWVKELKIGVAGTVFYLEEKHWDIIWDIAHEGNPPDTKTFWKGFNEGNSKQVITTKYERSPQNRQACIDKFGPVCKICKFDFNEKYGELANSFIEVHHINPLHLQNGPQGIDPITDLIPVCSNCHRMLHRKRKPVLSPDTLRQIIADQLKLNSNNQ